MTRRKILTQYQQQYITSHYKKMLEMDIAKRLGLTRFHVQRFKRDNYLTKNPGNAKTKIIEMDPEIFNVDELENWVA